MTDIHCDLVMQKYRWEHKTHRTQNSLEMTRLIDSISFLCREVFEMKAITSGFKTVTLTVFAMKFYIPTRRLRINLSVLCYSYLKIYLYDSTKLQCSKKSYYKFFWKGI